VTARDRHVATNFEALSHAIGASVKIGLMLGFDRPQSTVDRSPRRPQVRRQADKLPAPVLVRRQT